MSNAKRLTEIDRAKGVAILLVVLGHMINKGLTLSGADWYLTLHHLIYKFHMPFFMFISGMTFYLSYKPANSLNGYLKYVIKKTGALLPAYIIFGSAIIIGKLALKSYMVIPNIDSDLVTAFFNLFVRPSSSPAGLLWYVYVLLQLSLLMPLLLALFRQRIVPIIILAVGVHFIDTTTYLMLDRLAEYIIYFSIGCLVMSNYQQLYMAISKYYLLLFLLFGLSFFSMDLVGGQFSKLIIGLCSLPAIFALVSIGVFKNSNLLDILGRYTFSIYLLHLIVMGVVKGLMFKFISWDGINFILYFTVLLLTGIFVPIFIKRVIFKRVPYIDRVTG